MVCWLVRAKLVRGLIYAGNGRIHEALVIRGGLIVFAGGLEEAWREAGSNPVILDFGDHLITPGMIDAHCHLSVAGAYLASGLSLLEAGSIDEVKELVEKEASGKGEGEWIYGFGLDESRFRENRLPLRWDLDDAAPNNPVVLEHISGHLAVANSLALRIAGISRSTPSPPGGIIEKNTDGEPTGVLRDSAMSLVLKLLPPLPENAWIDGLRRAQRLWISRGFTAVEDTGTFNAWDSILGAYNALRSRGELVIRARIAYAINNASEFGEALGKIIKARERDDNHLRTNLLKVFYDGSGLARTALLYDAWCKDFKPTGYRGLRVTSMEDMALIFRKTLSRNIRVAVHAIGDRAVDEVIEAYLRSGVRAERCSASIVHALLVSDRGLELLGKTGICVKTQPGFIYTHGHVYAANFCKDRARRAFPLRSFLKHGVTVASSTDAPFVGTPNPVEGLYGAIYREPRVKPQAKLYGYEEALTFTEALDTYTRLAAAASGWDDITGVLEEGMHADLVAWSIRTLTPSRQQLLSMKPLAVMIDGNIVIGGGSKGSST